MITPLIETRINTIYKYKSFGVPAPYHVAVFKIENDQTKKHYTFITYLN